ncbi:hypothetical protein HN011_006880, partial [Eciton burchellii]
MRTARGFVKVIPRDLTIHDPFNFPFNKSDCSDGPAAAAERRPWKRDSTPSTRKEPATGNNAWRCDYIEGNIEDCAPRVDLAKEERQGPDNLQRELTEHGEAETGARARRS